MMTGLTTSCRVVAVAGMFLVGGYEVASAQALIETDCGRLQLQIDLPPEGKTCLAAGVSNFDARGDVEVVEARTPVNFVVAQYFRAGLRSYVERATPQQFVTATEFGDYARHWQPQTVMQGFAVGRFTLVRSVNTVEGLHCAAFVKQWGPMPGAPGYRHRVAGIYCAAREADIGGAELDRLLASVRPGG